MLLRKITAAGLMLDIVFSLAMSQPAFAQVGFTVSAGIADIATSTGAAPSYLGYEVNSFDSRKPKPAFQFGIWYTRNLHKRFSISTELLLSREGLNYHTNRYYGEKGYKLNNYYLNLPLAIQLHTNISKEKHSALYIAPSASMLINSIREVYDINYYQKDRPENMKRFLYGAGIGYLWDVGKTPGKWFIDLRYTYGISSSMRLPENASPSYYSDGLLFARNTTAMLGIKFMPE